MTDEQSPPEQTQRSEPASASRAGKTVRRELNSRICGLLRKYFQFGQSQPGTSEEDSALFMPTAVEKQLGELAAHLLASNRWYGSRFSVKYVQKSLMEIAWSAVEQDSLAVVAPGLDTMFTKLETTDQRKVCLVPLTGVKLCSPSFSLGRFALKRMDAESLDSAKTLVGGAMQCSQHTDEEKLAFTEQLCQHLDEHLRGTVCLEVSVEADAQKADEVAVREAETLLDLLRFLSAHLYPKGVVEVGYQGDGRSGVSRRYVLPLAGGGFMGSNERKGPFDELLLDERARKAAESLVLVKLAQVDPLSATKLEKAIFRAIHWFAESQTERRPENELVSLVIATECLFAGSKGLPSTATVAEATAMLLGKTLEGRLRLIALVREAFNHRGQVVHQGETESQFGRLKAFRDVVTGVIQAGVELTDRFAGPGELLQHLRLEKLRPKPEPAPQHTHDAVS